MCNCSAKSSLQGSVGLYQSTQITGPWYSGYGAIHVCSTAAPGPAQLAVVKPTADPKRLIIYSTKDQLKNSILANWVGADKVTYWQLPTSTYDYKVYNEIVVMPFDQSEMKHLQLT